MKYAALTFEEQITAAMLHYVYGVEQNIISVAFRTNIGRVNEACKAIKAACETLPRRREGKGTLEILREVEAKARVDLHNGNEIDEKAPQNGREAIPGEWPPFR